MTASPGHREQQANYYVSQKRDDNFPDMERLLRHLHTDESRSHFEMNNLRWSRISWHTQCFKELL